MAFQIADLYATIRADDAQIQGALPKIEKKLKSLEKSMKKVARISRRMFLGIAAVIGLTVKQASDAKEAHDKFMTVFRDEGKAVAEWAKIYGRSVGRAQVDMERFLGTIQDTLVPMGIVRKEATKLSKEIVMLGLDLASFNNEADNVALDNLQSALVGQSRAVLKYGVVINQAAVQQELLNMGIQRSYDLTTNQEKIQARLNIIFGSTVDAQGDLLRTQGTFENQSKAFVSALKDMNAEIGQAFIPFLIKAMRAIRGILPAIADFVTQNKALVAAIGFVVLALSGLVSIAPALLAALTLVAAHPVVAGLLALAAAFAAIAAKIFLARSEARQAAKEMALIAPPGGLDIKTIESRLALYKKWRQAQEKEVARLEKLVPSLPSLFREGDRKHFWNDPERKADEHEQESIIAPSIFGVGDRDNLRDAKKLLDQYTLSIVELTKKRDELTSSTIASAAAEKEADAEAGFQALLDKEKAIRAAQGEWQRLAGIMFQTTNKRKAATEELERQLRALRKAARDAGRWEREKTSIYRLEQEKRAALNKEFDDKEAKAKEAMFAKINAQFAKSLADRKALEAKAEAFARKQMGGARRTGFSGLAAFGRGIQESILKKGEDERQLKELQEIKGVELEKLVVLKGVLEVLGGPMLAALGDTLQWGD